MFKNDDIFSAPVRLLVKESHAIFSTIPRQNTQPHSNVKHSSIPSYSTTTVATLNENSNALAKSNVIAISRRYRSVIHECVENLTRDITQDHADQIKTFRELEVIWNLCEILLVDVSQTGTLTIQLKNWTKMHFDELGQESREILRLLDSGSYRYQGNDSTDIYWNLLIKLVVRGEIKKAVLLLMSHHEYESNNQLQLVANMLNSMPLANQYIIHEFCNKWLDWTEWCKRERATNQFDSNPHLLTIVRILSQDLEVYPELAQRCDTWYQLMVAYLIYTDPCIRETDLSELCRKIISMFKRNHPKHTSQSTNPDKFDEIIISAFEYDLNQVIIYCCSYFDDNFWFVTHFVDLLHCSNQLKIHEIPESDKLRECFLQDYASTLFDDELLWPIGVSYLDSCPTTGTHYLETLLSRVPVSIEDEAKAHKLISIAKHRGLNGVCRTVSLLMARKWLSITQRLGQDGKSDCIRRGSDAYITVAVNLSNALYWALKSGDTPIVTHISDQFLHYFRKTGNFPDRSLFDGLRRTPLSNERLAFLAKYFEFKQLMQESADDLSEAGNLFKALLASKIYPKFFCRELLEDAKNLLEIRPQLIFQTDKTLDLMRTVEEIVKEGKLEEDVGLRKNLIRNMARALITPVGEK